MRVAQIGAAYDGAQKIIERAIHKECISRGYESHVLYAIGHSDEKGIVCYESRVPSFCRRALRKYCGKNPHFARWSTHQLLRRLQAYQPDLVHLHVLHHGYLDYELLFEYLIKHKIPVVYTAHDMWAFTGGCYYYTKENCEGFRMGCQECSAFVGRLDNTPDKTAHYFALKKKLISRLSEVHFVAVSQWVADEMKKSFLAGYPITVIENGIEPLYLPSSLDLVIEAKHNPIVLLGVAAAWDERKGIDRIFEMARILGENYQFHLVGSVSEAIAVEAPKNVRFLGYVSNKAYLLNLYAGADLHISASFEETFGMTFVEAAFAGTRSIGYASTAVKSTLEGVYGIAVGELTAEAMAKEIQKLSLRKNMKLRSDEIQQVVNRYSCTVMAEKYFKIYESVLKKESYT